MRRGRIELKLLFRQRDCVVFTFALPAVLLLLGSIFTEEPRDTGVRTCRKRCGAWRSGSPRRPGPRPP